MANYEECVEIEASFLYPFIEHIKKNCGVICIRHQALDTHLYFMQKRDDIDLIIDDGRKNRTISVKAVKNIYENIFFELISNTVKGTLGWAYTCKADTICYAMPLGDGKWRCHYFKPELVKDLAQKNGTQYVIARGKTEFPNGDSYESIGYLIPLSDINPTIEEI